MRLSVCLLLLVVLACAVAADSNPLYRSKHFKLNPLVPLSHCTRLGPKGEFLLEWELSLAPKWTLEVRYTSDLQKGYSALGLANDTNRQIILGYPIENVHCSRALFDNYSPFDIYGNVYPNFPEVPGKITWTNETHVIFYMMRNLSISSRKFLDLNNEGGTIKIRVLWAFMQQSLFNAGCYMGNLKAVSEMATYEISLTNETFRKKDGICKEYPDEAETTGELVEGETDPIPLLNEINQNHRVSILFVGGNMLLDAGQSPPNFANSGYVVAGDNGNNVCSSTTKFVNAQWSGFSDPDGGITKYVVTIGTPERPSLYYDRFDMKTALSLRLPADMEPNTTYVATVTAYNFAGLTTSRSSHEIFVLNNGKPIAAKVYPSLTPGKSPRFQKSTTEFNVSWEGWLNQERQRYTKGRWVDNMVEFALMDTNETKAPDWKKIAYSPKGFIEVTTLKNGHTYYMAIRMTNCAGGYTSTRTSSVTVDTEPPLGGSVWFGNGTATKQQANYSIYAPIRLSWSGFTDNHSGMSNYTWALSKKPTPPTDLTSSDYIYKWEDAGFATTVSKPSINDTLGITEAKKVKKMYFFLKVQDLLGNEKIITVPNEGVSVVVPKPEGEGSPAAAPASPANPASPGSPAGGSPASPGSPSSPGSPASPSSGASSGNPGGASAPGAGSGPAAGGGPAAGSPAGPGGGAPGAAGSPGAAAGPGSPGSPGG